MCFRCLGVVVTETVLRPGQEPEYSLVMVTSDLPATDPVQPFFTGRA